MLRLIILIFMSAFITTGCATVNRGVDDHFRIDTVPQGAKITTSIETPKSIRNRRENKGLAPEYIGCEPTPCAIQLSRRSEFTFTTEHAGYEPVEMYVTSSNKRGSMTANTAASIATTAGTTAVGAASTASLLATSTGIATGIGAGLGASFTFGLVPIETAVSAGLAAGASAAPSTGALIASSIPPALAVTGGMLLIDAGTGANRNFYPNPVVLELAPKGSPVKYDPAVKLFKEKKSARNLYDRKCKIRTPGKTGHEKSDECTQLKIDFREKRKALKSQISPPKNSKQKTATPQIEPSK